MNILFIDDSEQLKNKQYVGIGGVIFHDSYIADLFSSFKRKKATHGIPPEEEIKWSPLKDGWIAKNLTGGNRISAYSDILDLIRLFNGKIIVAVLHRDQLKPIVAEAKWKCIKFVTERFQFYLRAHEDKRGIIIADFPGSQKEDKRLLGDYYQLLEKGTEYVKPEYIVMNLLTTQSHLNPALQVADLVVGITTAMCAPHNKFAQPYWDTIKHNFHRNQNGEVMGCGLKIYPREFVGEIHTKLFPEEVEDSRESYAEYIERMRYDYSVLMSEAELDLHFPRP